MDMDAGLLVARLVFGLLLTAHGCQKLFGWFRGTGLDGTAMFFESLGFHPGRPFVVAAALGECGGGLLMATGLLTPIASASVISVMFVAIATVHWGNGLLAPHGIEHPFLYLAAALALALTGPGTYSFDAALDLSRLWTPYVTAIVLGAGLVGGAVSLALRRPGTSVVHA